MRSAAVIVGIDEYANRPLSSAVNDAKAFRQVLLDLNLVEEPHITMLTTPVGDSQAEATRDKIADLLYEFYDHGESYQRFFFFYAGHGLLAFADAARSRVRTTLMPSDVQDLQRHGAKLLDLNEIQERFRFSGPEEQFFFIDACRDLDYESYPDVGSLGWGGGRPLGAPRRQATLYAVSELGKAEGATGGLGRMTTHLLEGLRSPVAAVDYDERQAEWVVSMQSLSDYVKWAVGRDLANEPLYKLKYMTPQLQEPDPKPSPIRVVDPVGPASLTIHIEPDERAAATEVDISLRGVRLDDSCLPPRRNHEPIPLQPQYYRVDARSGVGSVDPGRMVVDVRKEREATITVSTRRRALPLVPDSGPSPPDVETEPPEAGREPGDTGMVKARAKDPHVSIELEGLEPPYARWTGLGKLEEGVQAGPYRVRFRLGPDAFSQQELYVQAGEVVKVAPTVAVSPLVQESLGLEEIPPAVVISESIGPIQAGLLRTMLPIIGIKPFDVNGELFHQFEELIPLRDPAQFGLRPLSLVVAVDGNRWSVPALQVLRSIRCSLAIHDPAGGAPQPVTELRFEPLARSALNRGIGGGTSGGFGRIGLALVEAPANAFWLDWQSPHFGNFRLSSASISNRATVVSLTLSPDGGLDISQNLLRLPGRNDLYAHEYVPSVSYGRMVHELQLGQQLYRSGELISVNQRLSQQGYDMATDLLYAKWTDPILGCMAYFTRRRADEMGPAPGQEDKVGENRSLMQTTAQNLFDYFGELPDARVIYGLAQEQRREDILADLIARGEIPVLAESSRRLAGHARDSVVTGVARSIPIDQIWTLTSGGNGG